MRSTKGLAAGLCVILLAGCADGDKWTKNLPETVDAAGTVTLDGEPVAGAAIVFAPDGGQYPASALSDDSGNFALKAFPSKDGAVPGKYKVTVKKIVEVKATPSPDAEHASDTTWKNELPVKYETPDGSGLAVEVPAGGTTDLKLELTSK